MLQGPPPGRAATPQPVKSPVHSVQAQSGNGKQHLSLHVDHNSVLPSPSPRLNKKPSSSPPPLPRQTSQTNLASSSNPLPPVPRQASSSGHSMVPSSSPQPPPRPGSSTQLSMPSPRELTHGGSNTPALVASALANSSTPAPIVVENTDLKKVRKVRFNPYVQRVRLPAEELEEAQKARRSKIKEAPFHDEIWDGDAYTFRERELTTDELWALRLKTRVSSLPKKLKKGFKALASLIPGTQAVDQVSAHAHKLKEKDGAATSNGDQDEEEFGALLKLPLKRQSSSMRATEAYSEELTAATFARYDELSRMIETLKTAPEDLAASEMVLATYRKQLGEAKDELRRLRFEVPEIERRLDRNANPRLLHYMQFARDDKVKRLQQEYDSMKAKKESEQRRVEKLAMSIYEENERLDKLGTKLSQLRGAEAEREAIKRFVIQESGKDDPNMCRLWDAYDDLKGTLEKERAMEKKLRKAADLLHKTVIGDHLHTAEAALKEALELTKQVRPGGARQGLIASATVPTMKRTSLMGSYLMGSSMSGFQASPVTTSHATAASTQDLSSTEPIMLRRRSLMTARESTLKAIDLMERVLDDLEEHCRHMWNPSTLSWRREMPDVNLPEFFGGGLGGNGGTSKKKGSNDFEVRKKTSQDDMVFDSNSEVRIQNRRTLVHRLSELSQRYAEFIEREASRTLHRISVLETRIKETGEGMRKLEEKVFANARNRFATPKSNSDISSAGGGIDMQGTRSINKVARDLQALSVSSSLSPDDDMDDKASMTFPDSEVSSPRSTRTSSFT